MVAALRPLTRELQNGEALSVAEQALIRQAAAITVRVEALQADIVSGAAIDDAELVRLTNALHRLLSPLLKRRKGAKPPAIGDLLKSIEGKA
jgi:hypothetical protein